MPSHQTPNPELFALANEHMEIIGPQYVELWNSIANLSTASEEHTGGPHLLLSVLSAIAHFVDNSAEEGAESMRYLSDLFGTVADGMERVMVRDN